MCLSGKSMDGIELANGSAASSIPTESNSVVSHGSISSGVPEEAVFVRNAFKSYGVGKNRSTVLRNLSMNVKKGTIYGLLGASGCGKTTLLSCIVGRRSFDSGKVLVFGGEPGSDESGIPGPRLGYMPQELALYGEFTIRETLEYFGRIYNLTSSFVKAQMEFLSKLLELPSGNRPVKSLSGGQQRRVSFAVALFHAPELLILDEPTVGVDPMLRKSIWNHLVRLSADHSHTIIITTHYIEEASQAHRIGLMRSGRLLAEDSPANLMALHQLNTVEDVFLKLCNKDRNEKKMRNGVKRRNRQTGHDNPLFSPGEKEDPDEDQSNKISKFSIVPSSLLYKNAKSVIPLGNDSGIVGLTFSSSRDGDAINTLNKRIHIGTQQSNRTNPFIRAGSEDSQITTLTVPSNETSSCSASNTSHRGAEACESSSGSSSCGSNSIQPIIIKRRSRTFTLTMPSAHRTAALLCKNFATTSRNIGSFIFIFLLPALQSTIFNLAIGRDPTSLKMAIVNHELNPNLGEVCNFTDACDYSMFSCRYLRAIDNNTIYQIPYSNLDEAREAALAGKVWGVIHFTHNFTEELLMRQADGNAASKETVLASQIGVTLDWSNEHIALTIQRRLIEAFDNFNEKLRASCSNQEVVASIPLTFTDPIFGSKNPSFTEFMAPGIILTMAYTQALSLTAAVFIHERMNGLLDRSLVAGVQTSEILLAHTITQFTFLTVQVGLVLLVMMLGFNITCEGSLVLGLVVCFLQGLCGMFVGFVISSLCDNHSSALYLSLGSLYPNMLLSGLLWPLEGMSQYLRYVAYFIPMTHAIESLRNIFERGWGIERYEVYAGIIVNIGWIIGMLIVSIVALRIRKYTG